MHVDKLTTVMLSINSSGPKLAPKLMYGFYNDGLILFFLILKEMQIRFINYDLDFRFFLIDQDGHYMSRVFLRVLLYFPHVYLNDF